MALNRYAIQDPANARIHISKYPANKETPVKGLICLRRMGETTYLSLSLKTQGFVISEILSRPFFYAIASWQAEEQDIWHWQTIDKQCIVYQ